jgi:hypothetical protein
MGCTNSAGQVLELKPISDPTGKAVDPLLAEGNIV